MPAGCPDTQSIAGDLLKARECSYDNKSKEYFFIDRVASFHLAHLLCNPIKEGICG